MPVLSFKELLQIIELLRPKVVGMRVDRVFVPEANPHPEGFLKKEWVISLYGQGEASALYLNLRSQQCGLALVSSPHFKPSKMASRSGFDLSLSKSLVGTKITSVDMIENDRALILKFKGSETHELHLHLIPSKPFAVLISDGTLAASTDSRTDYETPEARKITEAQAAKVPFRAEIVSSLAAHAKLVLNGRRENLLALELARLEQFLNESIASLDQKIKSLKKQLDETKAEPDWASFGNLLKSHYHEKPEVKKGHFSLLDYEKDEVVTIPADPKLNLDGNLKRYFHLAKRKEKRAEESSIRIESLKEKREFFSEKLKDLKDATTESALKKLGESLGILGAATPPSKDQKKISDFSGKQYVSKEGLTILVGRNKTENIDLTTKIARGNDLWLHIKGKPGSHVVVLLPPKKTASLDTLLDAAHLCILYSGGKDWGKTEVDYTLRKYVKKIKGSSEVSYTQQKTLMVSLDPARVKRLYDA